MRISDWSSDVCSSDLYYVTAKGFSEKARLTSEYLTRSLSLFRLAREDCSDVFRACEARGIRRVVLVGAGDLCEIATLAAADSGIEVAAIFDQETNRQQMAGVKILRDPAQLGGVEAAVLTDMRNPPADYEHMAETTGADRVYFTDLL